MDIRLLKRLLQSYSPSGYETLNDNNSVAIFSNTLREEKVGVEEFEDSIGNACFSVGAKTPKVKIMISGHIDEIGGQVQYIDDDGFLHFIKDGGLDPKVLLGSRVSILKREGAIHGVIGKKAIHLEHRDEENGKVTKISDMKIDIGVSSKKEAEELVSVGDPFVVDGEFMPLGKYRFTSRGLDDKVGVFVVAEVLKALRQYDLKNIRVYGTACTQEEIGGQGAINAVKAINPDYSIDYDVTFATDDGFAKKEMWGDIKLGGGAAISHGPDTNYDFAEIIKNACLNHGVPFQEFCAPSGGTNTKPIKCHSFNTKTALISIPNRNMHTQSEICDYRDLESAIDLTVSTIIDMDKSLS